MGITRYGLKRPISACMLILVIAVLGITSLFGFSVDLLPELDMPVFVVRTTYEGADPETVNETVSQVIEETAETLNGINMIQAYSYEDYSAVMLRYEYDEDMAFHYMKLQNALAEAKEELPKETGEPVIIEMDVDAQPTLEIAAHAEDEKEILAFLNEGMLSELENLSSVAKVEVLGGKTSYVRVELRENLMSQYGLTMDKVAEYIAAADFAVPIGTVSQGKQQLDVSSSASRETLKEIRQIPLRGADGGLLRLEDIANVDWAVKEAESISHFNGEENVTIRVTRSLRSSALELSNQVTELIEKYGSQSHDVSFEVFNDGGDEVRQAVKTLGVTLVLGVIFAMIVAYLFFGNMKTSMIAGCAILISLLATLVGMKLLGYSLNIVSMGALIIAIGLITDTSLIVLESCFRRKGEGISRKEAATEGAADVAKSVLASIVTTIAVCLPLLFMKGFSAQLFEPVGYIIIFSALASLLSAAVFVPLFFVLFQPEEKKETKLSAKLEELEGYYETIIRKLLGRKELVLALTILFFAVSCAAVIYTDTELIPKSEGELINVSVEFRSGMKMEKIEEKLVVLEELIDEYLDIKDYSMTVSGPSANISLYLKENSKMSCEKFAEDFKEKTKDYAGIDIFVSKASGTSKYEASDAEETVLAGYKLEDVKAAAAELAERYRKIPGALAVFSSAETEATKVEVEIDSLKAMNYGLTSAEVAETLRKVVNGQEVMHLEEDGRDYSVYMEFAEGVYATPQDLMSVNISAPDGRSIPLSEIASLEYTDAQECIVRRDGKYIVNVSVTCLEKYRDDVRSSMDREWLKMDEHLGVFKEKNDTGRFMDEEFPVLCKAIGAAVFLIFAALTILFESPKYALMIMFSIPLGLFGAFLFVYITGSTWNLISLIGVLLLIGLVLNNAIRYTETANRLSKTLDMELALVETGKLRMRPILITALSLIGAILPLAVLSGAGNGIMQDMAWVIIGGMISATVLILLLFPVFYMFMYGKTEEEDEDEEDLPEIEEV